VVNSRCPSPRKEQSRACALPRPTGKPITIVDHHQAGYKHSEGSTKFPAARVDSCGRPLSPYGMCAANQRFAKPARGIPRVRGLWSRQPAEPHITSTQRRFAKGRYGGLLQPHPVRPARPPDPPRVIKSDLATEWEWNEDGTTLTHLAPGHKTHDGRPFTAEDVPCTIDLRATVSGRV
jgi:hypothetical protein